MTPRPAQKRAQFDESFSCTLEFSDLPPAAVSRNGIAVAATVLVCALARFRRRPARKRSSRFPRMDKCGFCSALRPICVRRSSQRPQLAPPAGEPTGSPIAGVFLTSADVDSVMGLLAPSRVSTLFSCSLRHPSNECSSLKIGSSTFSTAPIRPCSGKLFLPALAWPAALEKIPLLLPRLSALLFRCGGDYPDFVSGELRRTLPSQEAVLALRFEQGGKTFCFAPALPESSGEGIKARGIQQHRFSRRHLLVRRRTDSDRPQPQDRARNGPSASLRARRPARAIPQRFRMPQDPHPHQQHQSHPR